jgi:hypothetical protein
MLGVFQKLAEVSRQARGTREEEQLKEPGIRDQVSGIRRLFQRKSQRFTTAPTHAISSHR